MALPSETIYFPSTTGRIQTLVDLPEKIRGIALVAHPHPLFGGNYNNKVVYTLAHALRDAGFIALRPNFRGVGQSTGTHDEGRGETEDLVGLWQAACLRWPEGAAGSTLLAGFSFGAYVQTRVAKVLKEQGHPAARLILVGMAAGFVEGTRRYEPEAIGPDSLLIHGDRDTVVPLANVLAFAEPMDLPIVVIPGADHFFHGRLHLLRSLVVRSLADLGK